MVEEASYFTRKVFFPLYRVSVVLYKVNKLPIGLIVVLLGLLLQSLAQNISNYVRCNALAHSSTVQSITVSPCRYRVS